MTPTICFCLPTLNEATTLEQTVRSVCDTGPVWIYDTGSTDGTVELAKSLGCEVYSGVFRDFAQLRNTAFAVAREKADWVFMLSGGATVQHPERLSALLAGVPDSSDALLVRVRGWHVEYELPLLLRSEGDVQYRGATHEWVDARTSGPIDGVWVEFHRSPHEDRRPRWESDRLILEREVSRELFYLAQTQECLGNKDAAIDLYRARAAITEGYADERYIAQLRLARLTGRLHDLEKAADLAPHRAEALMELSRAWGRLGQSGREPSEHYRKLAKAMARPASGLFVEPECYIDGDLDG